MVCFGNIDFIYFSNPIRSSFIYEEVLIVAKLLDKIIIIDLESTCWEDGNHNRADGQISEIIEFGISLLEPHHTASIAESILVKPEHSKISSFCTQLTTLTQEMINKSGFDFRKACEILRKEYKSELRTWASWGDYDRVQIERDCKLKNIKNPMNRTHINLKNLFAIRHGLKKEVGLPQACEMLNIKFEGTLHRGSDDANNIAKIALTLL